MKPWLRDRRRSLRARISRGLARFRGTCSPRGGPLPEAPRSILICRINKRLGNTLFITPLIRALSRRYPDADIDVLTVNPGHARLFAGTKAVRRVIQVPRRPLGWPVFLWRLRRRRYDLAIDPSVNATTNRLGISVCRARWKLGFAGAHQWVKLTHATPVPRYEPHQARQALALLERGLPGPTLPDPGHLAVYPCAAAVAVARSELERVREAAPDKPIVGFFAGATGEKRLPASWWRQWADAMHQHPEALRLIQIVAPGSAQDRLSVDIPSVAFEALDRLAALIGLLDLFVAADSGPMHLGAAAGAPTVGLFRATDPADYAPLGRQCISLSRESLHPHAAADAAIRHLRRVAQRAVDELPEYGKSADSPAAI